MLRFGFKAISPVVSTALLIVVAVVALVGFQNWFTSYSSSVFTDTEVRSDDASNSLGIDSVIGNTLYVKYDLDNSLNVTDIKIGSKSCGISYTLQKGMNEIDLGLCPIGVQEYEDIVLITDKSLIVSKEHLKGTSRTLDMDLMYVNPTPVDGASVGMSSDVVINISSAYNLDGCSLYWDDGSPTTEAMTVSGKNCYITKSSVAMGTYSYYVNASVDTGTSIEYDFLSSRNLFSICVSVVPEVDSDGDGYFDGANAVYPVCNASYEGKLDLDDTTSSIGVTDYCWLNDGKSSCNANLDVDGCGSGTVLDLGTGLCWQRDMGVAGLMSWYDARTYCNNLDLGGHQDWRLPVISEMITIIDYKLSLSSSTPYMFGHSSGVFQNAQYDDYWSYTTDPSNSGQALLMHTRGQMGYISKGHGSGGEVVCVREN